MFVDEIYNITSNMTFIMATIAVSLFAGVLIIVVVILLTMLLKQRTDNKRLYGFCSFCPQLFWFNERLFSYFVSFVAAMPAFPFL